MRLIAALLLLCTPLVAQVYPKDYFRPPLDIPLQLSGNFGELRSNHFHAGLDFRTQQKEGFNIYAAAEGYVSRIKISSYGYGKAIYVTHPNGYTTVYGHLQRGAGAIERYIKAAQYKAESYEIEVFPKPEELPVRKGEVIAISGNTGGSQGPHLHFEIRDTKTENIINPLFFGYDIQLPDAKKPVVTSVVAYPLDSKSSVNKSTVPIVLGLSKQGEGTYLAEKVSANGRIGFGFSGYDMDSNSANRNGIYEADGYLNGTHAFGCRFDTYHFDETRYLNALIDYPRFKTTGQRVQKMFMLNPYPLRLLHPDANNGIITMEPNFSGTYRLELGDYKGNKSTVNIPLAWSAEPVAEVAPSVTPYYIELGKDYNFEKDDISVFFPAGAFYDPFYLDFSVANGVLSLNNKHVPVHTNFTVTFKNVPEKDIDKTFIATMNNGKPSFNFTSRKDGVLQARMRALGQFALAKDTVAPVITAPKNLEGKWISSQKTLSLQIRDNLSGIKEYKGYLNGKFILFEYEYKQARITHHFDDGIFDDGRNDLKVIVTDNVGNSAIFETHFFKSKTK